VLYASLQNIFSQFWWLQCDIFEILATQADSISLTIPRYKNFAQMTHQMKGDLHPAK
jgi:hypothetical protein